MVFAFSFILFFCCYVYYNVMFLFYWRGCRYGIFFRMFCFLWCFLFLKFLALCFWIFLLGIFWMVFVIVLLAICCVVVGLLWSRSILLFGVCFWFLFLLRLLLWSLFLFSISFYNSLRSHNICCILCLLRNSK